MSSAFSEKMTNFTTLAAGCFQIWTVGVEGAIFCVFTFLFFPFWTTAAYFQNGGAASYELSTVFVVLKGWRTHHLRSPHFSFQFSRNEVLNEHPNTESNIEYMKY